MRIPLLPSLFLRHQPYFCVALTWCDRYSTLRRYQRKSLFQNLPFRCCLEDRTISRAETYSRKNGLSRKTESACLVGPGEVALIAGRAPERCQWQMQRGGKRVPRSAESEPALTGEASAGHRKRSYQLKPSPAASLGTFLAEQESTAAGRLDTPSTSALLKEKECPLGEGA